MNDQAVAPQRHDIGFIAIVVLISVTAFWVLLTPFYPAVAAMTLRRFHLRSASFVVWAIQSPIPTMYNFANTYEVRKVPHGEPDPEGEPSKVRYANHFPLRVVTFADTRNQYLADGQERWYTIKSTYRGQTIVSRIHAKAKGDGQFDVIRVPTEKSP